jgi:hypothetical protein
MRGPSDDRKRPGLLRRMFRPLWVKALAAFGLLISGFALAQVEDVGPQLREEARQSIRGDPPLRAVVAPDRDAYADGFDIAVPDPSRLDPLPPEADDSCDSLFDVGINAGGFNIDATYLKLTVEGYTRRDVTIVGMRAKVLSRDDRRNGIRIVCFGGGEAPRIGLYFNLDDDDPRARAVDQEGRPTGLYFESKTVEVKNTEPDSFKISASTTHSVEWRLELDLIVDSKETSQSIPPDDKPPFRTSGRLSGGPDAGAYEGQIALDPFSRPPKLSITGMNE